MTIMPYCVFMLVFFIPMVGIAVLGCIYMMPSKRNTLPMPCCPIGNNISSIPISCLMPTLMQEQIFGACFTANQPRKCLFCFIAQRLFHLIPIVTILLLNNPSNQHIESPCLWANLSLKPIVPVVAHLFMPIQPPPLLWYVAIATACWCDKTTP